MILTLAILLALSGWGSTIAVAIVGGQDKDRLVDDAARKDSIIADLVHQIQANSQGYVAPTWVDPPAPVEERHVMYDDTGLIEVEYDPDYEPAEVTGM